MADSTGQVTVTYYGHCAFLWETSQGARVLVDPYRNREDLDRYLALLRRAGLPE